jgi:hypothetical protein
MAVTPETWLESGKAFFAGSHFMKNLHADIFTPHSQRKISLWQKA